jgi:hypothetical protein
MRLVVEDVQGVRAAVTTFASDPSSIRFVLVPISPLGVPAHYDAIRETLLACDLVVTMAPQDERGGAADPGDPGQGSQWERVGRGRRIRPATPPPEWHGVDRPFITATVVATDTAASPGGRPARRPLELAALAPFRPLMAMAFARIRTRQRRGSSSAERDLPISRRVVGGRGGRARACARRASIIDVFRGTLPRRTR